MKKLIFSLAIIAAMASCSSKDRAADTANIVDAEIVEENYDIAEPETNNDTMLSAEEALIEEDYVSAETADDDTDATADTKEKTVTDSIS